MAKGRGIRAGRAYVALGTDDTALARGLARAKAKLKSYGRAAVAVGKKLAIAGAAIMSVSTKIFGDFQEQMAKVSTMVRDTAKHMGGFTEGIRAMSVEFGESTETLADGLYQLLSAQIPTADAMDVLAVATKAAVGGFTDVGTSAKAMIRILRSYNISATEAADVSDLLFTIVEKGIVNYEELSENIGKVAPTAKAAGLSLEELGAAVATILQVEEPKRAMTALRTTLFEAAEAGMDLMSFVREFRGVSLEEVIAAGIPKKAAAGVLILSGNYERLQENIGEMANRAGAAERAYKKMANTLNREFARMKRAAVLLLSKIGDVFGIGATASLRRFTRIFLWAGDVIPAALQRIADIFRPLGRAIRFTVDILMEEIKATSVVFNYFGKTMARVAIRIQEVLLKALKVVSFGFSTWRKIVEAAVLGVKIGVSELVGKIKYWFTAVIPKYLDWFGENWRDIFDNALKVIKAFVSNVGKNIDELILIITEPLARAMKTIIPFTEEWNANILALLGFPEKLKRYNAATRKWKPIGLEDVLEEIKEFKSAIKDLPDIAEQLPDPSVDELKEKLSGVMAEVADEWEDHSERFDKVVDGIVDNIQEAVDEAKKARKGLFEKFPADGAMKAAVKGAARGIFMATSALSLVTPGGDLDRQQVDELKKIADSSEKVAKNTQDIARTQLAFK